MWSKVARRPREGQKYYVMVCFQIKGKVEAVVTRGKILIEWSCMRGGNVYTRYKFLTTCVHVTLSCVRSKQNSSSEITACSLHAFIPVAMMLKIVPNKNKVPV